ncbi:unnamed protein product [Ilex paraguariensis]|uniref:Pectinesterase n=1 Tax=Ilex paraguariensis TaxID=185542 RepID=A0ABC8SL99_9AQUA
MTYVAVEAILISILLFIPNIVSDDTVPIPAVKTELNGWFQSNVKPSPTLDPALATAEAGAKVIKVNADGSGDFKTLADAVKSVPDGNTNRVIVSIGPGKYTEKIKIERTKPFITFYGDAANMPTLAFGGTSAEFGTVDSATLIVESDYFSAVNIIIANTSPRPDGKRAGAQALALRIGGDKASFYNCKLNGFQDTLCDDKGLHFFKDCYIEGTVDFIFGNGKSIYVNTELHVIPGDPVAVITAQARQSEAMDTGYSFVHCTVTGTGGNALLGRSWMPFAKVVFAYTDMSDAVDPKGWSDNVHPETDKTVFFGEYNCKGARADFAARVPFAKKLTDAEAQPFISLAFIEGSKWLLPPAKV